MFFDDEKIDWSKFDKEDQELAEDALKLMGYMIDGPKKPKKFFIKGILLDSMVGYEHVSDEFKDAVADEIVYQWELKNKLEESAKTGFFLQF